jgi:hypothetical protein
MFSCLHNFFNFVFFFQFKAEEIIALRIVTPPKAIPLGTVITPARAVTSYI